MCPLHKQPLAHQYHHDSQIHCSPDDDACSYGEGHPHRDLGSHDWGHSTREQQVSKDAPTIQGVGRNEQVEDEQPNVDLQAITGSANVPENMVGDKPSMKLRLEVASQNQQPNAESTKKVLPKATKGTACPYKETVAGYTTSRPASLCQLKINTGSA
jgi:hypothetical protein